MKRRRTAVSNRRSILYHYTSADGLLGILSTGTLWATQIRFLNDIAEFTFARDVLVPEANRRALRLRHPVVKKLIRREIDRIARGYYPAAYVISFSESGNTLSQWRAYAPRDGVSIGFYKGALAAVKGFQLYKCLYLGQDATSPAQRRVLKQVFTGFSGWQEWVSFASSLIRNELQRKTGRSELMSRMTDHASMASQEIIAAALRIKHRGFAEEREWRLIDTYAPNEPRFRRGPFGVTPYLVAALPTQWRKAPLGIAEVVVGPTPNPDATMTSIRDLLGTQRQSKARVTWCDIPYRTW